MVTLTNSSMFSKSLPEGTEGTKELGMSIPSEMVMAKKRNMQNLS